MQGQAAELELVWSDISNEVSRTYHFPNGETYTINWPLKLNVKNKVTGDSHRVIADNGIGHYVRAGWLAISWQVKNSAKTVEF